MTNSPPEGLLPLWGVDPEIHVGGRSTLAWDVHGPYGAVFSVWLSSDGTIQLEAEIFRQEDPSNWSSMGTGGSLRGGWDIPFPPTSGWPFEGLAIMGIAGQDVEAEDGNDAALDAVFGFLAPPAAAIEVNRGGQSRVVEPAEGTRAFVALMVGESPGFVVALDEHGVAVGPREEVGHYPYRSR